MMNDIKYEVIDKTILSLITINPAISNSIVKYDKQV